MENIIEPNDTFDFTNLSLAHPTGIQGGAYFTKIEHNKKPLYVQTCKSQTRQGFVKTGKKYYCDLMFDKSAETLVNWFENLEEKCRKLIFEKRDTWFQNSLEETDIESAFNSIMRIYKSGKYYLVRTNVKNNHVNVPSVKIYNENEETLTIDDVKNDTNIISILEIQGIKFTSRNFQIELELKQIMILNNEPLFDNCLIKTKKPSKQEADSESKNELDGDINQIVGSASDITNDEKLDEVDETTLFPDLVVQSMDATSTDDAYSNNDTTSDNNNNKNNLDSLVMLDELGEEGLTPIDNNDTLDLNIENLEDSNIEANDDLEEIENITLNLESSTKPMELKKPNQVYFELYKEARTKAKTAKRNAILAYLEAKNIKKTYMLENLNDSDSDFDAEIDEVSESELDGL